MRFHLNSHWFYSAYYIARKLCKTLSQYFSEIHRGQSLIYSLGQCEYSGFVQVLHHIELCPLSSDPRVCKWNQSHTYVFCSEETRKHSSWSLGLCLKFGPTSDVLKNKNHMEVLSIHIESWQLPGFTGLLNPRDCEQLINLTLQNTPPSTAHSFEANFNNFTVSSSPLHQRRKVVHSKF